jgi:hypothetical protein
MKTTVKLILALLIAGCCLNVHAQTAKQNKKTASINRIKSLVNSQRYVFLANYVMPMRGGGHAITSYYDLKVTKDTVAAFLPYFGQATMANYGSIDNGINFTSTKFTYKVTQKKNSWDIVIVPLDKNKLTDALGVREMRLSISEDGNAMLQVNNTNRDPITFTGRIEDMSRSDKL